MPTTKQFALTATFLSCLVAFALSSMPSAAQRRPPKAAQKDAPNAESAPKYCSNDEEIVKKIQGEIDKDPKLKAQLTNVTIRSKQNLIYLFGWVVSKPIKDKVEGIAKSVATECKANFRSDISIGKKNGCGKLVDCGGGRCAEAGMC